MKKKVLTIAAILCMAFSAPMSALADGEPEQVDLEVSIENQILRRANPDRLPRRLHAVFR